MKNKVKDDELTMLYVTFNKSIFQISKERDIGTHSISKRLKELGIPIRGRNGILFPKKIVKCCVCDTEKKEIRYIDNIPYCSKHYRQIIIYGKILKRNKLDKNEIIIYDDFAEICLYNMYNVEIARVLIDIDDIEKIKNIKWHLTPQNYVRSNNPKTSLHSFILEYIPNKRNIIDHINRNRLDCRKNNLKITDYQENGFNKGKQSNNTSGYPGVSWDKYHNKYESNIKINRKKKFLGYFDTLEDAIICRQEAEQTYFGKIINRDYDINTIFKHKENNN